MHREEENYYAFSLSYSYSYSYDSTNNEGSYATNDNFGTSMPEYVAKTNTENEMKVLIDIEMVPGNSNSLESISSFDASDISLEESSVDKEFTVVPSIASTIADSDNVSPLATMLTGENNATIAINTSLNVEALTADSNEIENISSLAKTVIGAGIGFTVVVALLSLKKRQRRLLN